MLDVVVEIFANSGNFIHSVTWRSFVDWLEHTHTHMQTQVVTHRTLACVTSLHNLTTFQACLPASDVQISGGDAK